MSGHQRIDFKEVQRLVSLGWFFENILQAKGEPVAGSVRYHVCPACGASNGKSNKVNVKGDIWKCFGCNEGGDVTQAAAFYWGIGHIDAARQLLGVDEEVVRQYVPTQPEPEIKRDSEALLDVLQKLAEYKIVDTNVVAYLKGRGISDGAIQKAHDRMLLTMLPSDPKKSKEFLFKHIGKDNLIAAGLLKEGKDNPAIMYRPLVFFSKGGKSAEFRIIHTPKPGDRKVLRYGNIAPMVWSGQDNSKIMICEGAIDILSAYTLGVKCGMIGLPGCENYENDWFTKLVDRDVILALDNDEPGEIAYQKILPIIRSVSPLTISRFGIDSDCNDINDMLKKKLSL